MKRFCNKIFILLFNVLFVSGVWAQSEKIDSLTALLPNLEGEALAKTYLDLSKEYTYIDPSQTIAYAQKALPIINDNKNELQESYANLLIGAGHLFSGNFDEGKKYTDIGLEIARKLENNEYICIGLNSLAAYYMNVGEYDRSLGLFKEALEKAQVAGLKDREATARLNIGSILTNKGERTKGLRYLMEALKFFEEEGNIQIVARILNNVAVNYHSWKDYDKALEFYEKTLVTYRELKDYVGEAIVFNNIGEIYKDKGNYPEALKYYQETINIADSIDVGDYYKSYGWVGLAEAYLLTKDYALSRENAEKALAVFESVKMQEGISNAKIILAQVNLKENHLNEALVFVNESLELSKKVGIVDLEIKAYKVKAGILEKMNHIRDAYESLELYAQKTDTFYQQERTNDLKQLRSELEISEKENEIELLQKNNQIKDLLIKKQKSQTQLLYLMVGSLLLVFAGMLVYVKSRKKASDLLQQKNDQINAQHKELVRVNETKDKFLSIIGHDLRNPIGAFKDVISQLADFPEMFSDELRQQIIDELRNEAESTYFLLDNLLLWAKNQKNNISIKPERLGIASLVDNNILLNSRFAESKKIRLMSTVSKDILAFADHNMINLVLRNLISNAVKFTEDGGEIVVSASESGDTVEIAVADTGVGIAEADQAKLFDSNNHISTYGTHHEKGSGLGLLLCKEFVEANGGTINVKSAPGKGSTFSFTLKGYSETI